MKSAYVDVDWSDGGVVVVRLNRPDRRNAINDEMLDALRELCVDLGAGGDARALVLTGAAGAFCAGFDLDELRRLSNLDAAQLHAHLDRQSAIITVLRTMPLPVVAAIDGACVGAGLSLALAADVRLASDRARFRAPFVRLGLSGGDLGLSWLLPRVAGLALASELMLSARFMEAEEALLHRVVSRVVPSGELMAAALGLASDITGCSAAALAFTKGILHENLDAPSLEAALRRESALQVVAVKSPDLHEAIDAFQQKREPRFRWSS
ncbi:enoyl-CoA hydratase/isomerase family protein [Frankia sp. AgB32]|uniref:enoyl-CoA hydratase/isomerase family protein n=1 Tax=Frankia sp. AgB32 TaxID=631119 RepID=UPI00200BE447|nr:enoyl-CoA hydratase-related protein [Frankia sp. AgB32]MCK9896355.1 enoyl-CoA hydratase-related protein [Frankia sp. AgB32]